MDFNFKGRDIINGYDFTTQELCHIMDTAMIYEKRVKSGEAIKDMEGMLVATLFFEPSTRTRLSFNSAIQRMGASTIDLGSASASSQSKGETWQDTIRTVDGYVDAIVMRHPMAGSAIEAAEIAQHPLINGGDGARQHPTQALLDIYTMRKEKGHIGGQTITFLGDLKYGRTVHSLGYFMQQFGNKMIFATPEELKMPAEITADLRSKGADIVETTDVKAALAQSDADLQMPIIAPVSPDTWGVKESTASEEDEPAWGNQEERGVGMEVATAAADLTGGADAVILRHPASVATIKKFITDLM